MARKNHKWTDRETAILYNFKNYTPAEIKRLRFADDSTVTVQAIADKLSRVIDMREQPNTGKPWTAYDRSYLKQVVAYDRSTGTRTSNEELKKNLKRGSKEIDQAYYDLKHNVKTIAKHKTKQPVTPGVASKATVPTSPNKIEASFSERSGQMYFDTTIKVRKSNSGHRDLVKELRAMADKIEHNKNFYL